MSDPVVDRAMADALPTADRVARRIIVLSLLERQNPAACGAIVRHFDRLDRPLRQLVLEHIDDIEEPLRTVTQAGSAEEKRQAVEMIAAGRAYRLAMALGELTRDGDAGVTRAAATGLLSLAAGLEDQPAETATARGSTGAGTVMGRHPVWRKAAWLGTAITEAVSSYGHHGRRDVLLAALAMAPRRFGPLVRQLSGTGPAANVLRELIRSGEAREIDGAVLWCAGVESLAGPVTERLGRRGAAVNFETLLRLGHLLALPSVRGTVRKAAHADHLLPGGDVTRLSVAAQRQLTRWLGAISVEPGKRAEALGHVSASEDKLARLMAVRQLMAMREGAADDAVATFCFDGEAAIARIALRHLMTRRWHGLSTLMVRLVSSAHEEVRTLAERELAPVGFGNLWVNWERLEEPVRKAAGRALMKIDRDFHRQLAARMQSRDADDRFKAVMIARQLEQETYFETLLIGLAKDAHHAVASAAVAALGALHGSPQVAAEVKAALSHANDRVKANAVEALEQLGVLEEAEGELMHLARRSGNRSRANAIKALLKLPLSMAEESLRIMLTDRDPAHRLSALWVVERMAVSSVGRSIAEMARADVDAAVRRRAMRVLRKMAEEFGGAGDTAKARGGIAK